MGQYDDISEERLRADLVRFAELLLRLEEEGGLLVSPADLQKIMGELRQKLFAWEIRCSRHLGQGDDTDAAGEDGRPAGEGAGEAPDASIRVVREAMERQKQMIREWSGEADRESDE
jgi:hypothetical protein